ncbi:MULTISPECIES: phytanoyl-CoA dioxygenase family protein [Actinomadura]|uniref:Phytanoyl-CoA dioxygenase family protein n=1 Tax=Actinomadura yumaensis TaxID=111807 RepID=A0ABW2CI61_9ACTN|nr:phytanoyl-CoA dioxygenase family protein [Actinomadura sp. J1-007]
MFGHDEITHFGTFGFVVLRGLLSGDEVAGLREEARRELRAAFGDGDGDGDELPLSVDRAPFAQSLIADDPRLFQGAADLWGTPMVPTPGLAARLAPDAPWHTDHGPEVGGVNYLVHLEPRAERTGALRVLPGSHEPGYGRRVAAFMDRDPSRQGFRGRPVPYAALETEPGDVIAFHPRLFHASEGGGTRLAWRIGYLPWPGIADAEAMAAVRYLVADTADGDGYDRDRWPAWREWADGPRSPSRQVAVERLELLGIDLGGRPTL